MKERPIIFSAPMVRAILAGTKTQTRRVVKPIGQDYGFVLQDYGDGWLPYRSDDGELPMKGDNEIPHSCPYGQPGDRLWVRETWQAFFEDEVSPDRPRGPRHTLGIPAQPERKSFVFYKADGPGPFHPDGFAPSWRSPLHLRRKYSRITLEVTNVRVERLQDISEADARAEGAPELLSVDGGYVEHAMGCHRDGFEHLWASINGPGSWDANPWVWVVEFRRVDPGQQQG